MAGSYPDVPGYRFAYDVDGSALGYYSGTAILATSAQLSLLNDDNPNTGWTTPNGGGNMFFALFPESREITGILLNRSAVPAAVDLEYSNDSTDGYDGTWATGYSGLLGISSIIKADLRNGITPVSIASCKALRFATPAGGTGTGPGGRIMKNIHIYGYIAASNSKDRLRVVDTTLESTTGDDTTPSGKDIAAQLDFGNISQRSNATKIFRIINNSDSKTAINITISISAATDASPSLIGQYQISTDNISYANAVNLGSLGPGESSSNLYLRMSASSTAQLSAWSVRIIAHAVSWS